MATSSSRRATTSPWAITAWTASTAATGASFHAQTSSDGRSSSTGPSSLPRKMKTAPAWAIACNRSVTCLSTSSIRRAGAGPCTWCAKFLCAPHPRVRILCSSPRRRPIVKSFPPGLCAVAICSWRHCSASCWSQHWSCRRSSTSAATIAASPPRSPPRSGIRSKSPASRSSCCRVRASTSPASSWIRPPVTARSPSFSVPASPPPFASFRSGADDWRSPASHSTGPASTSSVLPMESGTSPPSCYRPRARNRRPPASP